MTPKPRYISIHEKSYPNPESAYIVRITKYGRKYPTVEYTVDQKRVDEITGIVGIEKFGAELDGGRITLHAIYAGGVK